MIAMLAVFGVGHTELLILGLICCLSFCPSSSPSQFLRFLLQTKLAAKSLIPDS